jgi:hypothetical protein
MRFSMSPRFLGTLIITAVMTSLVAASPFTVYLIMNYPTHVPGEVIQSTGQQRGFEAFVVAAIGAMTGVLLAPFVYWFGPTEVVRRAMLGR